MVTLADIEFDAQMSAKYHRRRAAFLERTSAAMSASILFGGAGAFASLFGTDTKFAMIATAAVALIGIVQIVFQTDRCAAEHRHWLREWNTMLAEIGKAPAPSEEQIATWNAQRYDIESECAGELRALQVDCYNRTMAAMDLDGKPVPIRWWQRALIQVVSFEGAFQAKAQA